MSLPIIIILFYAVKTSHPSLYICSFNAVGIETALPKLPASSYDNTLTLVQKIKEKKKNGHDNDHHGGDDDYNDDDDDVSNPGII